MRCRSILGNPVIAQTDARVVLTKAVVRAAEKLDAESPPAGQRARRQRNHFVAHEKGRFRPGGGPPSRSNLACSSSGSSAPLDAIVGGDETVARAWLGNANVALDGRPVEKIRTVVGLVDVIAYLDARRALV